MSRLRPAIDAFEANARARVQAETATGQVWQDTVLRRLTDRKLDPLAQEERRFLRALTGYDVAIDGVLHELGNY
ncbi:hypothetical protein GFY24_30205 [Nocardia sp. SYP-A9097]|uniref:hypothetical protein n=1 Tax=Nocardia sp. SYP-A9097 TaxID=2663237 RepID=UPI00129B2510|nr:hypothetical protein [Nocardia sp. SYP-A9097]MRH91663.1 hypothetical protein [Nocardia sp. SYP-A9097]